MFKNRKNLVSISLLGGKKKTVKQIKKSRHSCPEVFCKNRVLKNCEFCKIFKNNYFVKIFVNS